LIKTPTPRTLTQARLRELLHYNPETGIFTRITANSPRAVIGATVEKLSSLGYIHVKVDGVLHKAHRLAFLYMEGYHPEFQIDHKNGIRNDNRWKNLRHVTQSCNKQNQAVYKNNTQGYPGVYKHGNRFYSTIVINSKRVFLGSFKTVKEAILARLDYEESCPDWHCDIRKVARVRLDLQKLNQEESV
jgi:hypothetical protein